jgi:phage shock protein A
MDIISQIVQAKNCTDLLARKAQLQTQLDDVNTQLTALKLTDAQQQASVKLYSDVKTAVSAPTISGIQAR